MTIGFDNEKYIRVQSEHIRERIAHLGNKLYLEMGVNSPTIITQVEYYRASNLIANWLC